MKTEVTPVATLRLDEFNMKRDTFRRAGLEAIDRGEVALLLLAGGMGTRLGYDGPKGTYPIEADKSIFACLFDNLREEIGDRSIPFFVMTSDKNDEATRAFFEEKNYFGYDPSQICFYRQEMAQATDFDGAPLYEDVNVPATSPNGNGGFFKSLIKAGYRKKLEGVRWLNVFGVDNVLAKIADPEFIGALICEGKHAGVKAVMKTGPDEKVGVVCARNGRPSVIDYTQMTEEMCNERDKDGNLVYAAGVTVNYLFDTSILLSTLNEGLPVHKVEKKIPYLSDIHGRPWRLGSEPGEHIEPTEPNGYKYEIMITDLIEDFPDFLPVEVEREKEFAPVKNLHGVDSVDSARELLKRNGK